MPRQVKHFIVTKDSRPIILPRAHDCIMSSVPCRICGGALEPYLEMPIDAIKDEPTPFKAIVRCSRCGTGTVARCPKPDEVPGFYELPTYYTHGVGMGHVRDDPKPSFADKVLGKLSWWAQRSEPLTAADIAQRFPQGSRICDIGCGDGALLVELRDKGFNVTGVDPDPSAAAFVQKQFGITVLSSPAEDLPAAVDQQFDLVLMRHSLEHCIDPVAALDSAYRITQPGGCLYCEVPNCACVHFKTLNICSAMFDLPRHLWFFTPKGLKRAIEDSGYRFSRYQFGGFTRLFSPGWRQWEMTIADRLARRSVRGRRHTFYLSIWIFLRSVCAPRARKYDSVGVFAHKPDPTTGEYRSTGLH